VTRRRLPLVVAALALVAGAARAESLIVSVSTPRVAIQSNFSGADIVVFGGIGREAGPSHYGRFDIVVTVRGPVEGVDVRRKDRVLGVWINNDRRPFRSAPSYLAIASTRPIADLAKAETIRSFGLTLETGIDPGAAEPDAETKDFLEALIRLKSEAGLYLLRPGGVTFLSDDLFRATIPLPANVPLGIYQVETRLLGDGKVLTGQRASLEVIKTGFDDQVARYATQNSALYGLATCALALALGFVATVVFRRD
jgi:uncharacterized protein (TIGR02186 family)